MMPSGLMHETFSESLGGNLFGRPAKKTDMYTQASQYKSRYMSRQHRHVSWGENISSRPAAKVHKIDGSPDTLTQRKDSLIWEKVFVCYDGT